MPYADPKKNKAYFSARYKANRAEHLATRKAYYERKKAENPNYLKELADRERERFLGRLGVTQREVDQALKRQKGGCAFCGRKTHDSRDRRLAIDHDHKTNTFRGLLCYNCNVNLGWYEKHATKVHKYLRRVT